MSIQTFGTGWLAYAIRQAIYERKDVNVNTDWWTALPQTLRMELSQYAREAGVNIALVDDL